MEQYAQQQELNGLQLNLSQLEEKLPAPAKKPGVARLLCVALALVAVLGVGGIKLRGQSARVQSIYTEGTEQDGYSIRYNLDLRQSAAANLITMGESLLGKDAAEVQSARAALTAAQAASGPAADYAANNQLASAVDLMYQSMQPFAQKAGKAEALSTQWSEFLSRNDIISHDGYNLAVSEYQTTASGFPARLLGTLWGVDEVEPFA